MLLLLLLLYRLTSVDPDMTDEQTLDRLLSIFVLEIKIAKDNLKIAVVKLFATLEFDKKAIFVQLEKRELKKLLYELKLSHQSMNNNYFCE